MIFKILFSSWHLCYHGELFEWLIVSILITCPTYSLIVNQYSVSEIYTKLQRLQWRNVVSTTWPRSALSIKEIKISQKHVIVCNTKNRRRKIERPENLISKCYVIEACAEIILIMIKSILSDISCPLISTRIWRHYFYWGVFIRSYINLYSDKFIKIC